MAIRRGGSTPVHPHIKRKIGNEARKAEVRQQAAEMFGLVKFAEKVLRFPAAKIAPSALTDKNLRNKTYQK
jgi:hypothetical protein